MIRLMIVTSEKDFKRESSKYVVLANSRLRASDPSCKASGGPHPTPLVSLATRTTTPTLTLLANQFTQHE